MKILILSLAGIVLLSQSVFIIEQAQQAIVLQFGQCQHTIDTPGLKFKIPFIQDVLFYEKKIMSIDVPPIQVITKERKRLDVDTYSRYKITNPLQFFQTVKPATEEGVQMRLTALISSAVRNVLGRVNLRDLLSPAREKSMQAIQEEVSKSSKSLGISIVDIRIVRTELPEENRKAVFARMNSELERFAKENRAKGEEQAQKIRSTADKEKTIILAEAQKKAQISKGSGDAKAIEISTKAFSQNLEFYSFYRSLESYRITLKEGTKFVLSSDSPYLHFMHSYAEIK